MFASILSRTFRSMARTWQRVLVVYLAMLVVYALVFGFIWLVQYGYGRGGVVGIALASLVSVAIGNWAYLAAIRAASGTANVLDSITTTAPGALRLIPYGVVVGAVALPLVLVHPLAPLAVELLLVVPTFVALGSVAREPRTWGFGAAWRLGVLRLARNVGAYFAVVVVLVLVAVLAGLLGLLPIALLAGIPTHADTATATALADYLASTAAGAVIGAVLASFVVTSAIPALIWAVYTTVADLDEFDEWHEDNLEAVTVEHEMSPVVEALVGRSSETTGRRRMQVPPRAAAEGRLPGPGEMSVAGVTLPPGTAMRDVDSPALELDAADAAPMVATTPPSLAALWMTADVLEDPAPAWKRLAAGFADSGLWPVLVHDTSSELSGDPWYERRSRRERDMLDASPEELFAGRLDQSLAADTPFASVELLRASGVAARSLRSGSGRRGDAVQATLDRFGAARLGLVPARAPADAVHRLAWPGAAVADLSGVELAAMLGSWEQRWGALLVGLDEHALTFAVLRPPTSLEEAIEAAAEHHALYPDELADFADDQAYAAALVDAVTWTLTWS
jgi:hypothetical protein